MVPSLGKGLSTGSPKCVGITVLVGVFVAYSTFLIDEETFLWNAETCHGFETQLGGATDKSFEDHSIHHIWDTNYGNVHPGYMRLAGTYNGNIPATSNIGKTFERL
jgi:hypothetical protein